MTVFVDRIATCWRLKLALSAALATFFCVPYFLIGNYPIVPVHTLPLSAIDRAIGFDPAFWVWIYQSEYLLINVTPWLSVDRAALLRYARGFLILCVVSFVCFAIYPIRAPKPQVDEATGMYWLLQQYDVPLNSLPSLHAALVVYTLRFAQKGLRPLYSRGTAPFIWAWAGLILYATLATKEHYLVDIIAGALLALLVDAWVWRDQPRSALAASEKSLSSSESMAEGRR